MKCGPYSTQFNMGHNYVLVYIYIRCIKLVLPILTCINLSRLVNAHTDTLTCEMYQYNNILYQNCMC